MGQVQLGAVQIAQRHATASRFGKKNPIAPILVIHRHHDSLPFLTVEMVEERHRREGHRRRGEIPRHGTVGGLVVQQQQHLGVHLRAHADHLLAVRLFNSWPG